MKEKNKEIKDEGGIEKWGDDDYLPNYKPIIASDGVEYRIFAVMAHATSDPDGEFTYHVQSEDEAECYKGCLGEDGELFQVLLRKSKNSDTFVSIDMDTHHLRELQQTVH